MAGDVGERKAAGTSEGTPMKAEDVRAQLSELLNRVAFSREQFVITRHGKPVARLVPVEADAA